MEEVKAYRCEGCKGTGKIWKFVSANDIGVREELADCPTCNGRTQVWLTKEEVKELKAKEITKEVLGILAPKEEKKEDGST